MEGEGAESRVEGGGEISLVGDSADTRENLARDLLLR